MPASLMAGAFYFLLVFAVGFLLGTIRVLLLAPGLGATAAVLVELPVILAASWYACSLVLRGLAVPAALGPRAIMGALAFGLLMMAELAVARYGFRRSLAEHVATYRTAAGALGLAGQIAFALFPLVQRRAARTRRNHE